MPPTPAHDRFLSLVDDHRRAIAKICWAYGRTPHDRDDLFQEIIARLWAAFPAYDSNRPFLTWMYRVALNVAIDHRRRQRRWGRECAIVDEAAIPSGESTARDDMLELHDLLDQQTDADRALLLLHLEGRSYREVGDILGMSETNVGTRLARIKESMRRSARETEHANGATP